MVMNVHACVPGRCKPGPGGSAGLGDFCPKRTNLLGRRVPPLQTRCRTIPIFRKGNIEPEEGPNSGPLTGAGKDGKDGKEDEGGASDGQSSSEAASVATDTQDVVADWDGTLRDGTVVRGGWFGGDSVFTVALIVGLVLFILRVRRLDGITEVDLPSTTALPDDPILASWVLKVRAQIYGWPEGQPPDHES